MHHLNRSNLRWHVKKFVRKIDRKTLTRADAGKKFRVALCQSGHFTLPRRHFERYPRASRCDTLCGRFLGWTGLCLCDGLHSSTIAYFMDFHVRPARKAGSCQTSAETNTAAKLRLFAKPVQYTRSLIPREPTFALFHQIQGKKRLLDVNINQNRRSRQTGMTGHDRPEYPSITLFSTMVRNSQTVPITAMSSACAAALRA